MMNVVATTRTAEKGYDGKRRPICETLDLLKEAGFAHLDWYAPVGELFENPDMALDRDACTRWAHGVRARAEAMGVRFCQMHCLEQDRSLGGGHVSMTERMIDNALYAAQILGIRDAAIHPIIMEAARRDFKSSLSENTRWLREKAEVAEKLGMRLAVENMLAQRGFDGRTAWRFCTTWEEHCALVEAVDCENVGYCFDVGHANYTGTDVRGAILGMGKRLFAIHVHDNDAFSDQHLLPFQGTVDFETFARSLACAGYAGNMTMETIHAANKMPAAMAKLTLAAVYEAARHLAHRVEYYKEEGAFRGISDR